MNNTKLPEVTKVDVEDLVKEFKVLNVDSFTAYLKEIWRVKYFNSRTSQCAMTTA